MNPTNTITAPDGWAMRWNLHSTPARVDYVQPSGQVYSTLSGQITEADLARYIKRFRAEHRLQQMRMEV